MPIDNRDLNNLLQEAISINLKIGESEKVLNVTDPILKEPIHLKLGSMWCEKASSVSMVTILCPLPYEFEGSKIMFAVEEQKGPFTGVGVSHKKYRYILGRTIAGAFLLTYLEAFDPIFKPTLGVPRWLITEFQMELAKSLNEGLGFQYPYQADKIGLFIFEVICKSDIPSRIREYQKETIRTRQKESTWLGRLRKRLTSW